MITKRKFCAAVALVLALGGSAEILKFGPDGLPNCAYDCTELYAAQYDCGDRVECFCAGLENAGNSICGTVCGEEIGKVQTWLSSQCPPKSSSAKTTTKAPTRTKKPEPTDTSSKSTATATPTESAGEDSADKDAATDPTVERATTWWKKNWPFFLMAFLLVTIPILLLAFFVPFRKYVRRQIISRRSRASGITIPPLYVPPREPEMTEYNYDRRVIPGSPRLEGQVTGEFGEDVGIGVALSPGLSVSDLTPYGSGGAGRFGTVGSSGLGSSRTASDYLGSEVGLKSTGATTVRQESWERRLREKQKQNKRWWWSKWFQSREVEETPALGHGPGSV